MELVPLDNHDFEMLDDFYSYVDVEVRRCLEESNNRIKEADKRNDEEKQKLDKVKVALRASYKKHLEERQYIEKKYKELVKFREKLEQTRVQLYEKELELNKRIKLSSPV